jgi:hypothetical protein
LAAATPGDFLAIGRNVLLSLGKLMGLVLVCGTAAGVGAVVAVIVQQLNTQPSWLGANSGWIGAAAGWMIVAGMGCCMIPLVSLAFKHFDVGRDTPA